MQLNDVTPNVVWIHWLESVSVSAINLWIISHMYIDSFLTVFLTVILLQWPQTFNATQPCFGTATSQVVLSCLTATFQSRPFTSLLKANWTNFKLFTQRVCLLTSCYPYCSQRDGRGCWNCFLCQWFSGLFLRSVIMFTRHCAHFIYLSGSVIDCVPGNVFV